MFESTEKIAGVRNVQGAAEAAMQAVVTYLRTNTAPTSERAHMIIDDVLATHHCESPEGHIVAGGQQSAEPHEQGSGLLLPGQPIVIDIYPRSKRTGYWADMTRTICIGEPTPELQRMFDTVAAAQKLAISMLAPGVTGRELQEAVEYHFTSAGYHTTGVGTEFRYTEGFVHAIGHGVSTVLHDHPILNTVSTDVLTVGDIIAIEPGLYYHAVGGVRLEDVLLVTKTGSENLSNFPTTLTT